MFSKIKKIFYLLNNKQKKLIILFFFLSFFGAILELLSVGLIFPFIGLLLGENDNNFFSNLDVKIKFFFNFQDTLFSNLAVLGLFIIFFIFIIKNIYLIFLQWFTTKLAQSIDNRISNKLYELYIYQPYSFFLEVNTSTILRNIKDESLFFRQQLLDPVLKLIIEYKTLLGILLLLFYFNPAAALLGLFFITFFSYIFIKFTKNKIKILGKERQFFNNLKIKNIQQTFIGIKQIKLLNKENFFLENFKNINLKSLLPRIIQDYFQTLPRYFLETIGVFSLICVFIFLIKFNGNEISEIIKLLGLYAASAFKILPSANRIIQSNHQINFGKAVLDLLTREIQNLKKTRIQLKKNNEEPRNKETKFLSLEFKNVSFFYKNRNNMILKDINVIIKKNDIIAIQGKSGSGKSTFVDLLIGLIQPTQGKIFFNDKNVESDTRDLQKKIGYVPQDSFILDDTIKNNIIFGNEIADDKLLTSIIDILDLRKLVNSLPDGLETVLGERGVKISGGQKQRIGIARTLYNKPEFLIFDEATNSLDKNLENKILENILKLQDITIIIITHNLYSLKKYFNKLITIENSNLIVDEKVK